MRIVFGLILFITSFTLFAQNPPAPDFTVTDTDGLTHTLYQDYLDQGYTVAIKMFFVACPPCNSIAPSVQQEYEYWGSGQYDVQFFEMTTMQFDDDNDVIGFKNNHGITFPSISAEGGSIQVKNELTSGPWGPFFGTPSFYVISPEGNVASGINFAGLRGAIESTGAMGPNMTTPTTSFSMSITDAANNLNVNNVELFITDSENIDFNNPIDLDDYTTIEDILEDYPNISNPSFTFKKSDDQLNQVSALDISRITKHVLGLEPFIEDYKYTASDINGDQAISALDLSALTKVVLGLEPFEVDPWVFEPAHIEIDTNPGGEVSFDVTAIKIGNVN